MNRTVKERAALQPATPSVLGRHPRSTLLIGILLVFAILAIGGYTFNWTWTGFTGNTLWNWLELLVLPVVLALLSVWLVQRPQWQPWWTLALVLLGLVFIVLAIGGYVFHWTWTGFTGNTLWDWLKLLVLPVVLAIVVARMSAHANDTTGNQEQK